MRGIVFALAFLVTLGAGIVTVAYAAANPGGQFGEILNKILASGNWQTPGENGKVKDAAKL